MPNKLTIKICTYSDIIFYGLKDILEKLDAKIEYIKDINFFWNICPQTTNLIIIDSIFLFDKSFADKLKKSSYKNLFCLITSYPPMEIQSYFVDSFLLTDDSNSIISKIQNFLTSYTKEDSSETNNLLSEREIEVLKLLVSGLQNKEIADKLNISINTVLTHRKNITQKTGIKSVSGLTIYAVLKKIITLKDTKN